MNCPSSLDIGGQKPTAALPTITTFLVHSSVRPTETAQENPPSEGVNVRLAYRAAYPPYVWASAERVRIC